MQRIQYFLILLCILTIAFASESQDDQNQIDFQAFKKKFNKQYENEQHNKQHQEAYKQNVALIEELNALNEGKARFKVNKFADFTDADKKSLLNMVPKSTQEVNESGEEFLVGEGELPEAFDYTQLGAVSPVKDQGLCGACWAFSSVGMLESIMILEGQGVLDLSEQYVLSCTPNSGCGGGWGSTAIDNVLQNGIPQQKMYPYIKGTKTAGEKVDANICTSSDEKQGVLKHNLVNSIIDGTMRSLRYANGRPISQMKKLLLDNGPYLVTLNANDILYYEGGKVDCQPTKTINHESLLVGWTSDGYWKLKNSWGTNWGEEGFYYINQEEGKNCYIGHEIEWLKLQYKAPPPADYTLNFQGSGVQGNSIRVFQHGRQSVYINGNHSEPFSFDVNTNIETTIRVGEIGGDTSQVSFTFTNQNKQVICRREAGYIYHQHAVFCRFTPANLQTVSTAVYQYSLSSGRSSGGRNLAAVIEYSGGYNGTLLAFLSDRTVQIGGDFYSGTLYGPNSIQFRQGVTVQFVAYYVPTGSNTTELSYSLLTDQGILLAEGSNRVAFVQGQILAEFYVPITHAITEITKKSALRSSSSQTETNTSSSPVDSAFTEKQHLIAIIILSILLLISVLYSIASKSQLRQLKNSLSQKKQSQLEENRSSESSSKSISGV